MGHNIAGKESSSMTGEYSGGSRSHRKVVYAENDRLFQEAISEILGAKGFEVYLAEDGMEALLTIKKVKPDFVILDIVMPKLDGSRVCWLMRQDPALRDTPVIAFSGLSASDFRQFPELSADAYVAKGPLATAVNNVLKAITYLDEKGRLDGMFEGGLFGYDGVFQRQMVKEMLQEKKHQTNILRSLGAGVLEMDVEGRILMANAGACAILGHLESQLIGKRLAGFCHKSDQAHLEDVLVDLSKTKEPEEVAMVVDVAGHKHSLRLSSIVDEDQCTGVLAIFERGPRKSSPEPA
jgi:PAS domain S-box-containing protein